MASINVNTVRTAFTELLQALDKSGSFADAVSKLSSEDARISTTFSAIVSLASLATKEKNMATRFHLGSIGGVLGLIGLGESVGDGRHDLNDIAALSAVLGAYLSRIPNPQAQILASYFNVLALAPAVGHTIGQNLPLPHEINAWWNQAKSWVQPRRDPLALDLDGDGIETRGADGKIVFDHNNDGVKTGTGWLRPDDGWLVLDRNSNGTIDNGGELFGVDTVKSDGTKATDGFDALSDLDSNDDGVFDAKDTRFADVRVWRDLNQDGVSQSNELSTLAANNIRSINLSKTTATTNLGNGNAQTATATYTRTDDTTGTAANLELANNTFYRKFTNRVTLTDNAKKLPEVSGSGRVRNLREAMSGSSSLATLVDTYAKQTTYASQRAQLDGLVRAWAGTADQNTSIQAATAKGFDLIYMIPDQTRAHFARSRRWL